MLNVPEELGAKNPRFLKTAMCTSSPHVHYFKYFRDYSAIARGVARARVLNVSKEVLMVNDVITDWLRTIRRSIEFKVEFVF